MLEHRLPRASAGLRYPYFCARTDYMVSSFVQISQYTLAGDGKKAASSRDRSPEYHRGEDTGAVEHLEVRPRGDVIPQEVKIQYFSTTKTPVIGVPCFDIVDKQGNDGVSSQPLETAKHIA